MLSRNRQIHNIRFLYTFKEEGKQCEKQCSFVIKVYFWRVWLLVTFLLLHSGCIWDLFPATNCTHVSCLDFSRFCDAKSEVFIIFLDLLETSLKRDPLKNASTAHTVKCYSTTFKFEILKSISG